MTKNAYGFSSIQVSLPPEIIAWCKREAFLRSSKPPYIAFTVSDIVRMAIIKFKNSEPKTKVERLTVTCNIMKQGSRRFCIDCGLSWDTSKPEVLPPCPKNNDRK